MPPSSRTRSPPWPASSSWDSPPLEAEPRTHAHDARREHFVDGAKLRARLPGDAGRHTRVEQIEQIHVERHPAAAVEPEILRRTQVGRRDRIAALRSVRLEPERDGAELTERQSTVRILGTEDVGP